MKLTCTALLLTAAVLTTPFVLTAQSNSYSSSVVAPEALTEDGSAQTASPVRMSGESGGPVSRLGISAGVSTLGIQLQTATNLTNHINVRASGNFFNYNTNFNSDGISATGTLSLQSVGAAVDLYPFRSGFRLSPGVLATNQNQVTAVANVPAGTSFTLNGATYYSANTNAITGATPITGNGVLNLSATKPAFTITAGWGNTARGHGHWSVPVDVGVAFIGAPTVKVNLAGWACNDQAQTQCSSISNPANPIAVAVQSNLSAQVAKWNSDLNPLKTYPMVSVGLAYSFHIR